MIYRSGNILLIILKKTDNFIEFLQNHGVLPKLKITPFARLPILCAQLTLMFLVPVVKYVHKWKFIADYFEKTDNFIEFLQNHGVLPKWKITPLARLLILCAQLTLLFLVPVVKYISSNLLLIIEKKN